jgi:hypothetical protein
MSGIEADRANTHYNKMIINGLKNKSMSEIVVKDFVRHYQDKCTLYRHKHYKIEIWANDDGVSWIVKRNSQKLSEGKCLSTKFKKPHNTSLRTAVKALNQWLIENPETALVYALVSPFNKKHFYIGSTRNTLSKRLGGHISTVGIAGCGREKNKNIRRIMNRGKKPIIVQICKCPLDEQFVKEFFYKRNIHHVIKKLKKLGYE